MHACLEGPTASLATEAKGRVEAYVRELLRFLYRDGVRQQNEAFCKGFDEYVPTRTVVMVIVVIVVQQD